MVVIILHDGIMGIYKMCRVRQYLHLWIYAALLMFGTIAPMALCPETAVAQSIQFKTQSSEIYAGMPFNLSIILKDFDESPQPEIEPFEISDADVQLLGVSPQISSMTSIINGRMTSRKDVSFVFSYQITPKREGSYLIPVLHARQGSKEASSKSMTFSATSVQKTTDMKLELQIPERKFWVGETFEATLLWYLRKDVEGQQFNIPVLEMSDTFDVSEPDDAIRGQSIPLTVGSRQVYFPYTRDIVMKDGLEYSRFMITLRLTPLKSGVIEIPPSKVLAELESGKTEDMWGFARSNYQLFQAEDVSRTCTVQELPQSSKPQTFSNAMGSDYAIQVSADRTIVKAGEPIVLTIDISSPSSMDGLILPSLVAAGLNEQLFGVSTDDQPVGENINGGSNRNIKRFTVPVRIKSERVTEIPPLAFSYFNPKTAEFTTVRSQPIALSVTSVDKIKADDVFSAKKDAPAVNNRPDGTAQKDAPAAIDPTAGSLELNLVSTPDSLKKGDGDIGGRLIRIAIYVFPFLVWLGVVGIRRTRKSKNESAPQREAVLALKKALDDAAKQGAREASSAISNALNGFLTATETDRTPFRALCERMDVEAYRPNAEPLSKELIDEFRNTVTKHVNPAFAKIVSSIFALMMALCIGFAAPENAAAQSGDDQARLTQASQLYYQAMNETNRQDRISAFKRAYAIYQELADKYPGSADLQVDTGNAALGAVDFGHAALAYRRALELDPSITQAQNNLAYIQSVQNEPAQSSGQLISTAFFLNGMSSKDVLMLVAAICFAIGVLLIIPWSVKHRRVISYLSIIPFLLWIWVIAGVMLQPDKNEGVVINEYFLKTADNPGASNISQNPLAPGYTVEIVRSNGDWFQIQAANGQKGWIQKSAIELVRPR